MFAAALALAVSATGQVPVKVGVSQPTVPVGQLGQVLPDEAPVHLGISLRAPSLEAMRTLAAEQQDPASPSFRVWLSPDEFGMRFGLSAYDYGRVATWLSGAGFQVTGFADRLFIEAFGTHAAAQKALGVTLYSVLGAAGNTARTFQGEPQAPGDVAGLLLNVTGLDTQRHFRPLLLDTQGDRTFGPQDLRRFYDLQPLLDLGYTGRGAKLVVLGMAVGGANPVQVDDIRSFFATYADTQVAFQTRLLPNVNSDYDLAAGVRGEMELDVEVQAIAAPGAASITLEVPPASEQLSTGAHDVATMPNVTAVSTSFGICEAQSTQTEAQAVEQLVLQGTLAGQTWVAAAGDRGSDDCGDGVAMAVDMPADVPEMVAAGGSEVQSPVFDSNNAITNHQRESVWNQSGVGAGGGGRSAYFGKPAWQTTVTAPDMSRDMPDLALFSAPSPGVAVDADVPARTTAVGGTSVAAPLAAGIFAVLADRLGCRLGGVNPALYAVGLAQLDGGVAAFYDIVGGDNGFHGLPGASAVVGYDLASGWGSIDVVRLAAAFPACPTGTGTFDAGPLIPYDSCTVLSCPAGASCVTTPEGPSQCVMPCDPADAGSCGSGSLCVTAEGGGGQCVPGCLSDADCQGGALCDTCTRACRLGGNEAARVGDPCQSDGDCAVGGTCLIDGTLTGGYCSQFCDVCGCAEGALCVPLGIDVCLRQCLAGSDCRAGYFCQPLATDAGEAHLCLPGCKDNTDCATLDPGTLCDDGLCVAGARTDGGNGGGTGTGGTGGGAPDGGADGGGGTGTSTDGGGGPIGEVRGPTESGSPRVMPLRTSGGGGCSQAGGSQWSVMALLALAMFSLRPLKSRNLSMKR